jgi:hypothetical protein
MQLVIKTYGSNLRKNGDCFLVKKEDKVSSKNIGQTFRLFIELRRRYEPGIEGDCRKKGCKEL